MMGQPLRVLIVDDSAEDAELMVRALERGGRSVAHERVQTEAALASALAKPRWDVVLPTTPSRGAPRWPHWRS